MCIPVSVANFSRMIDVLTDKRSLGVIDWRNASISASTHVFSMLLKLKQRGSAKTAVFSSFLAHCMSTCCAQFISKGGVLFSLLSIVMSKSHVLMYVWKSTGGQIDSKFVAPFVTPANIAAIELGLRDCFYYF